MSRPTIAPRVWRAPAAPKVAPAPLPPLTVVPVNGVGPEDVVVVDDHVYTGVEDGRLLRLTSDGRRIETVADTGGRPLGIERYPDGRLLVCDAGRGLLLVSPETGDVEVLVPKGPDLRVCNNAAVAQDGTIYFTDSSARFDLDHYQADLLEHSGTGRLLRRTPDGAVDVLLPGLHFANGVALAPDESWVVVASTGSYRLDKVELPSGAHTVLDDNLPGLPDNISTGSDGLVWVALAAARLPALDLALRLPPVFRKAAWALPESMQLKDKPIVWVRAVDGADGRVVHDFRGFRPDFHLVTGVREVDGVVHLGSLEERAVAHFVLP